MGVRGCILNKGKTYYLYDSYSTWEEAKETSIDLKKKSKKCKHIITQKEVGFIIPYHKYYLYTTHYMTQYSMMLPNEIELKNKRKQAQTQKNEQTTKTTA